MSVFAIGLILEKAITVAVGHGKIAKSANASFVR